MEAKVKLYPADREALNTVRTWIESNPTEMCSLKKLCIQSGLNRDKLKKGFKMLFGSPIYQYHVSVKMREAKRLLAETYDPVRQIAYMLGYEYTSSFCNEFKKISGESPAKYRNRMQSDLFVSESCAGNVSQ